MMFNNKFDKSKILLTEYYNYRGILPLILEKEKLGWLVESFNLEPEKVIFRNKCEYDQLAIVVEGNGGLTINGKGCIINRGNLLLIPKNSIISFANVEEKKLQILLITLK